MSLNVCGCFTYTCCMYVCVCVCTVYACLDVSRDESGSAVSCPWFCGSACSFIMHQTGSLPQEPRGTAGGCAAPRRGPGFTPHEGDMNNRRWRQDCSTTRDIVLPTFTLSRPFFYNRWSLKLSKLKPVNLKNPDMANGKKSRSSISFNVISKSFEYQKCIF